MEDDRADAIGKAGPQAESERAHEAADSRRARSATMVPQRELNEAVAATIYGWGGRARFDDWDPTYGLPLSREPMGCRLNATLADAESRRTPPLDV